MDPGLKASLLKEWNKAEEFSNGVTEKFTMDNGREVAKMEVECGKEPMGNPISDNGKMVKFKALVSMSWKTALATKDNLEIP